MAPLVKFRGWWWLLALVSAVAWARPAVRYHIDIDEPAHHEAQITMLVPPISEQVLELRMASWRTGRYLMLPLANGVMHLVAETSSGRRVPVRRVEKDRWQVEDLRGEPVEIRYRLYANSLGTRTRHIDATHAFLDLSTTLLYAPALRQHPVDIELTVPKGWRSVSGLAAGSGAHEFRAENWDEAADSPIETGLHQSVKFKVGRQSFELIVWGVSNLDINAAARDLAKIAAAQRTYWGEFPFDRFIFMVHATDGARGATEHPNSTVIQRPRWRFGTQEDYFDFLATASHELVHAWNVKAYRPQGLVPYRFNDENYTDLLWFVEGGTSYLDELMLVRAGILTPKQYLKRLSERVEKHLKRPGVRHMSPAESSFIEWIAPKGEQAWNRAVNIYRQGEMLSLWLDLQLQQDSQGKHSIRDVHRKLYQAFPVQNRGYTSEDLKEIFAELGLKNADEIWEKYVEGAHPPPVIDALKRIGVRTRYQDKTKWAIHQSVVAELGLELDPSDPSGTLVKTVTDGTPAWQAGLTAGDRIVALDGIRIHKDNLAKVLRTFKPKQLVELAFFHNDRLQTASIRLQEVPSGRLTLELAESLSAEELKHLALWLGQAPKEPQQ